jgi:hypothetical protein
MHRCKNIGQTRLDDVWRAYNAYPHRITMGKNPCLKRFCLRF